MQIRMPLYFDDLKQKALRELAGEAGASNKSAFPATFIVDQRLRLRFYRPGFRYSMVGMEEQGQMVFHFHEDAPENQTIEHYVTQILGEKW